MSKLNPKSVQPRTVPAVAAKHDLTVAYSANGNLQFKKEPLQMLYELTVSTMFGKGNQLTSADALTKRVKDQVRAVVTDGQFDFIANLAIHARTEMNVRTIPIVVVVEFAKALADKREPIAQAIKTLEAELAKVKAAKKSTVDVVTRLTNLREAQDKFVYADMRRLVGDVIQRADQITDLYAYALATFGSKNKIPMAIKRGVADAFNKFSEYAFGKYNRDGSVKFRDVLRIVHPEAKDQKQGVIFDKIMKETLETPYTWETELSANGQLPVAERKSNTQLWGELVSSGKMGYMALLRNLRNINAAGLDSSVLKKYVYDVISDPKRVAESKQLPYDFMEAYNIVKNLDSKMATAVSKAIDLSVANIPQMGDRVWLIVDYSGSMGQTSTETSAISGGVFLAAAMLKANSDSDKLAVTLFGSSAKTLKDVDTNNSLLAMQTELISHRQGSIAGSTEFGAALAQKSQLGFEPDTIIVITDGEVNRFPYSMLKDIAGKKVMKMTVNMSTAFSTPMIKQDGWYTLSGWSTGMFKWIPSMRDASSAVDQLAVPYFGVPKKGE